MCLSLSLSLLFKTRDAEEKEAADVRKTIIFLKPEGISRCCDVVDCSSLNAERLTPWWHFTEMQLSFDSDLLVQASLVLSGVIPASDNRPLSLAEAMGS